MPSSRRLLWLNAALAAGLVLGAHPALAQRSLDEVRAVYAERQSGLYDAAAEDFLDHVGTGADARARAQLALVVPDSLLRREPASLVRWWRAQDPLPATDRNERLVEFLGRVATARRAFPDDNTLGFDVRGEIFVRYGRPSERRSIDVEADLFISRAIRQDPTLRRSDFPSNVIWYYPNLGPDVYFVFVERRGEYRLGRVMDLVPQTLLAGGLTRVTEPRARLLGQVLRWLYKDLYTFSAEFRDRLVDIDAAVDAEGRAFSGRTGLVLQSEVQKARQSDETDHRRREETLPLARTQVQPSGFGVAYQAVAFRDAPQDSVSVWLGWGVDPPRFSRAVDSLASLGLVPERYVVAATATRYDPDYRPVSRAEDQVVVAPGPTSPSARWLRAPSSGGLAGVAVQWTLASASSDGMVVAPGAVAAQVARVDAPATGLESASGLLAVDAASALALEDVDRLGTFPPPRAPGPIPPGEPVAVYFEVYGNPGDRFRVETRAVQVRDGRFLRSGREQSGASASDITLDGWRYPVLAVVDTGGLDAPDEVRVEVTVTPLPTGASITRHLTFRAP